MVWVISRGPENCLLHRIHWSSVPGANLDTLKRRPTEAAPSHQEPSLQASRKIGIHNRSGATKTNCFFYISRKTNGWNPRNEGLEDDFSFERVWFSGSRIPGLWFAEDVFIYFFIALVFGGGIVINPVSFDKAECWNGITFFSKIGMIHLQLTAFRSSLLFCRWFLFCKSDP